MQNVREILFFAVAVAIFFGKKARQKSWKITLDTR